MDNKKFASEIISKVGGRDNIHQVTHCMTRLRFSLNDPAKADKAVLKNIDGVMGVADKGGYLQLIIGPQVADVYDEIAKEVPGGGEVADDGSPVTTESPAKKEKGFIGFLDRILGALAGCMTPAIPVLLACGIVKTIAAVFGPTLLGWIPQNSNLYTLFTFVGDAGFYFMPVYIGYTAAKKFECTPMMGILMGAILIHPTLVQMATDHTAFDVYGIPASVQNYSSTVIPIILTVWIMSYVERWFKKHTPDAIKVFGVPFGTLIVMLPLALCVFGPLGAFIGQYVCQGIIALNQVAGPLAMAIIGGLFTLLVMTGMHTLLYVFLFTTFPTIGYDALVLPSILMSSWAMAGVCIACILKFKDKKKKDEIISYFVTWLLGGVGEPMLYGLFVPYKTPLYANVIAGCAAGLLAGILGLKAYVLIPSNGIYGLAAFLGGSASSYPVFIISVAAAIILGFVVMWFMKLDERGVK